ncbi:MAG: methyltransferase domain-containing protein [Eubacteriales bacterium]
MKNRNIRFVCPECGDIDKDSVEIYNAQLRKQNFSISPIVPTCKHCLSEIIIINAPEGAELIILNGTCGSGKSTVAEEMMKNYGYAVIDGDCMIQSARHRFINIKIEYNSDKALDEIVSEINILAAFGDKIILSHIILPEDWDRYTDLFLQHRIRFIHILLKPDIETAISRCNTRTCHTSITPEYWIRFFDEKLTYGDNDDIFILDNTGLSVDETIMKILKTKEDISQLNTISHYEALIDENNDPVHDPEPLRAYMDEWDGQAFIDELQCSSEKDVFEIGVGTGRLAVKAASNCREFYGIDLSPKTIKKAEENLAEYTNIHLICNDFMTYSFHMRFDIIYSSLTFMHIKDKKAAIHKAADLLNSGGRFVLSIDKNQQTKLDFNNRRVEIFPDTPEEITVLFAKAGLIMENRIETEFAYIFAARKV